MPLTLAQGQIPPEMLEAIMCMGGNKPHGVNPHTSFFNPAAPDMLDHVWAGGM